MKKQILIACLAALAAGNVNAQNKMTANAAAVLELPQGTSSLPPLRINYNTGVGMSSPLDGAIEYDNSHFWGTIGSTRYQLDNEATNYDNIYWKNGGNSFTTTVDTFGSKNDRAIDFITNGAGRARWFSNGRLTFGSNSDLTSGVGQPAIVQVDGSQHISGRLKIGMISDVQGSAILGIGNNKTLGFQSSALGNLRWMMWNNTSDQFNLEDGPTGMSIRSSGSNWITSSADFIMSNGINIGHGGMRLLLMAHDDAKDAQLRYMTAADGKTQWMVYRPGGSKRMIWANLTEVAQQLNQMELTEKGDLLVGSFKYHHDTGIAHPENYTSGKLMTLGAAAIATDTPIAGVTYYTSTSNFAGGTPYYGTVMLDVFGVAKATDFILTSDRKYKTNIAEINKPFDIINSLQGHTYNWNEGAQKKFKVDGGKRYGFIAQEVEKVLPEAVAKNEKGDYGVMYNNFIPILVEGQKELYKKVAALETNNGGVATDDAKVAELENRLNAMKADNDALKAKLAQLETNLNACCNAKSTTITDAGGVHSTLAQNVPNPFNGETVIGFSIVEKYTKAFIGVYDMNGREINTIAVSGDMNQVTIAKGKLQPGMYTYSLVVDNNLVDTKKMVVTE
jgi:hypothetical protein